MRYEVAESNKCVTITIEKKTPDDFTFWVRTVDETAKAGEDYEENGKEDKKPLLSRIKSAVEKNSSKHREMNVWQPQGT